MSPIQVRLQGKSTRLFPIFSVRHTFIAITPFFALAVKHVTVHTYAPHASPFTHACGKQACLTTLPRYDEDKQCFGTKYSLAANFSTSW